MKQKNRIMKAEELPKDEKIYLKKGVDGYRVVHPYKNDDGSLNWFNILTGGSWWNLAKLLFLLFIILGISWSYAYDTKNCRELIENPCEHLLNISIYCNQQEVNLFGKELEFGGDKE